MAGTVHVCTVMLYMISNLNWPVVMAIVLLTKNVLYSTTYNLTASELQLTRWDRLSHISISFTSG